MKVINFGKFIGIMRKCLRKGVVECEWTMVGFTRKSVVLCPGSISSDSVIKTRRHVSFAGNTTRKNNETILHTFILH